MRYIHIIIFLSFVARASACDGGYLWRQRLEKDAAVYGGIYGRSAPTSPRNVGEPLQSGVALGVTLLVTFLLRKRLV